MTLVSSHLGIAFFDFDGTLTKHDTFISFAKHCVGQRRFFLALIRAIPTIVLWKTGFKTNLQAKETLFSYLYKGMRYADFQLAGMKFAQQIDADLRRDVVSRLQRHIQDGHTVVIVSASISEWILPWAKLNGVDSVITTEVSVDEQNRLTGRFSTPNCHGQEKATRIKAAFPDIDDNETWGYGNSAADWPMLKLVNHPYMT